MAEPTRLHIKRRATDDAPDYLVLQGASASHDTPRVRYVKKSKKLQTADDDREAVFAQPEPRKILPTRHTEQQRRDANVRTFYLSALPPRAGKKRKGTEEGIATFVERKRSKDQRSADVEEDTASQSSEAPPKDASAYVFKRPGKGSAVKHKGSQPSKPETKAERAEAQAMADYMHEAMRVDARTIESESRPPTKAAVAPKISGASARERHRQRTATNKAIDVERGITPESDDEFVYETYILARVSDSDAMAVDNVDNIGYLIIAEEQQALWETYLEDDASDRETNEDDEDENAEDYYGADYPEDEVASDDEFDRNPYDYRGRAEDDEEWDNNTGEYSEEEDAYEKMMNPFNQHKIPKVLAKYLQDGNDSD